MCGGEHVGRSRGRAGGACTHLNDTLRSLGNLGALLDLRDGALN